MKKTLLKHAADIDALGKKLDNNDLTYAANIIATVAASLPEDSLPSSETTNDEENSDGGIEVPKKPPPP